MSTGESGQPPPQKNVSSDQRSADRPADVPAASSGDSADWQLEELRREPWQWWRKQMPIAEKWAYFDHAAVAPLSLRAAAAIGRFADQAARAGDTAWPQWSAGLGRLRGQTAELLSCERGEVCLIPNTTTGINLVAQGWPWQAGDSVVVPQGEFPSNLFPWMNLQSRGVQLRLVPRRDGEVWVEDLIDRVDASTKMIAVSWVGYASGYRLDVDRLVDQAHRRGVAVFLDAIQGLGMYPLDLSATDVDFLAADGHKWLLGPEGAGVAVIRRRHLERIECLNVGWGSVKNSHNYAQPELALREDASRFESGSANMLGNAALSESMQMFLDVRRVHGTDAIERRVVQLVDQLNEKLRQVGATSRLPRHQSNQSGIFTFELPGTEPAPFGNGRFNRESW